MNRGDAADATRRVAATPRARRDGSRRRRGPRRRYSAETGVRLRYTDRGGAQRDAGAKTYASEEEAARAYNAAIKAHGLESLRVVNKVDAAGRLIPKPKKRAPAVEPPDRDKKSRYYGVSYRHKSKKFKASCFCRVVIPQTSRGAAAAGTRIVRGDESTPRMR